MRTSEVLPRMSDAPKISVLMAVHNGLPFVPRSIESVLGQSFDDFELLVVDDGSTDGTPRAVEAVADPRIRYHRLEKVGFPKALNYGLAAARAPLIARIDADDLAFPTRLAEQYETMFRRPDCIVLGCQAEEIDPSDAVIGGRRYPVSDAAIRWQMAFGCPFLHPGTIFRREPVLKCGGYDTDDPWAQDYDPCAQDYDLWTRLAPLGTLANHPKTLMRYRVHPESVTTARQEAQVELCSRIAASYAKRLSPAADEHALADLYHFLASGRDPKEVGYDDLVRAYRQFKHDFLEEVEEPSDELSERIARVQRDLRWYCLEQAEKRWLKPWQAWTWLRRAGRFDPENGTLGRLLSRKLRKTFSSEYP